MFRRRLADGRLNLDPGLLNSRLTVYLGTRCKQTFGPAHAADPHGVLCVATRRVFSNEI